MRYDMYLMQVKAQKDSTEPWDYYNVVQKIPAAEAYTKLAESKCPLVKKWMLAPKTPAASPPRGGAGRLGAARRRPGCPPPVDRTFHVQPV